MECWSRPTKVSPLPFPILQTHRIELILRCKDHPVRVVALEARRVTIGRDPANQIVLEDDRISRFHAYLELSASGYSLCDVSTNGSLVNGEPVTAVDLASGDVITMGAHRLEYVVRALATAPQKVT